MASKNPHKIKLVAPVDALSSFDKGVYENDLAKWQPLVWYVVNRFRNRLPVSVSDDELFSAGMVGLMNASRSYDSSKGATFKTYAYHRIRGGILDDLRRLDFLPRTQREKAKAAGVDAPAFVTLPVDENGEEFLAAGEKEAECENMELMELIRNRIQDLPEKMRQVMTLYYSEGQRMRDIGEELGLTESRVSQIHTNAIQRLRRLVKGLS